MRSTAVQLQKQYREQIKAQAMRSAKQNLRTLRWALCAAARDPKVVEDIVQTYAKRLRGEDETD